MSTATIRNQFNSTDADTNTDSDDTDDDIEMEDDDLSEHNCTSFIPTPHREQTELKSIQSIITNEDCNLPWPRLSEKPLNEFETEGLATMAFPTLFPYGTGDPTTKNREHPISYTDFFKHLI